MLLASFLFVLIGAAAAVPRDELMSDFEFLDRSTNLDEPAYRLRDNVYPTTMNVELDVYLDEARFNGLVQIEIDVTINISIILETE